MGLKSVIDNDLKQAMLSGNQALSSTLKVLKSEILNAEIASGKRNSGLSDEEIAAVLHKEAKKRQESADIYKKGGSQEKADAELAEAEVIKKYLPQQLSDTELSELVVREAGEVTPQAMGQIIGKVKAASGGRADGARIAVMVKKRIQ